MKTSQNQYVRKFKKTAQIIIFVFTSVHYTVFTSLYLILYSTQVHTLTILSAHHFKTVNKNPCMYIVYPNFN